MQTVFFSLEIQKGRLSRFSEKLFIFQYSLMLRHYHNINDNIEETEEDVAIGIVS